jgi:hypothetical protein
MESSKGHWQMERSETMTEPDPTAPPTEPEPIGPEQDTEPTPEPSEPEPAEEPETPASPEVDGNEPPAPPSDLSPKAREKQQKALDAEAKRHKERLEVLLGAESDDVNECPFCDPQLQGWYYEEQLKTPRDEIQAAMIGALMQPLQVEYLQAGDVGKCTVCDGLGMVSTGSRVPGKENKACHRCRGFGYFPPPGMVANGDVSAELELELVTAGAAPMVVDEADAWGSPRHMPDGQENPNWGRMPQYKDPNLP